MAIAIHGDPDGAVSHLFLDVCQGGASLNGQTSEAVWEIMEADLPQFGALQDVPSVRLVYKPQKLGIKRTGNFGVTNTGSPRRFLVPSAHNAPRSNPSPG